MLARRFRENLCFLFDFESESSTRVFFAVGMWICHRIWFFIQRRAFNSNPRIKIAFVWNQQQMPNQIFYNNKNAQTEGNDAHISKTKKTFWIIWGTPMHVIEDNILCFGCAKTCDIVMTQTEINGTKFIKDCTIVTITISIHRSSYGT